MNEIPTKNPDRMKGDFVIFHNPTQHQFVDLSPQGRKMRLKGGAKWIIPKTLAIWFIGDYESPFGPTDAEQKAIYERNRYQNIFCKVLGPAPEESKPDSEETVEEPKEALKELAENPERLIVDPSALNRPEGFQQG